MGNKISRIMLMLCAMSLCIFIPLNTVALAAGESEACRAKGQGYWLVASDGGIFSFGDADFYGSTGAMRLNKPIVGMATTASGNGYYLVASDGGIFTFGDAQFFGSTGNIKLQAPIVGMKPTSSGNGYWMFAEDGGVFTFGDAQYFGSKLQYSNYYPYEKYIGFDVDSIGPNADSQGYWIASDSSTYIQPFGNVDPFSTSPYGRLAGQYYSTERLVGVSRTEYSDGMWVATNTGGVMTAGNAPFYGSAGNIQLNKPIVAIIPEWYDSGYRLIATDGGVFSYGSIDFCGSTGAIKLNQPIVGGSRVGFPV